MRINVYAEELTTETELITKTITEGPAAGMTFYGVRMYLKSPAELHATADDDDRSAITFWVPWTRAEGHDFNTIERALHALLERHDAARALEGIPWR